ncbi:hypothetical protein Q73A0000_01355 [Kaistella flava (ex Peng et al. 2021)]|uniref:Chromosomal replication initiator DnaA C-terminal domain-containing protein n=1 Tax=Kaistella flava (ex Peng et al. 2021) TaxID=2038776 RepID=A0A7M2Y5G1_9FLAO|nr:hypothetical protein [Kaistella flava (ex Peng et al. 2021)]QOW09089.1 hypothetical protein Q73A0000_01355 [Kaistella flava (ex Peng et al. 2021)]
MMTIRQSETFSYKVNSELAILKAANAIEKILGITKDDLRSRSRVQDLVTARILFTSMAFGMGARNKDIAAFLERNKASIVYFLNQNYDRTNFDKDYISIKQKINIKKYNDMANSLIEDIAAAAAKQSSEQTVIELLTVLKEMGIIKGDPKLTDGIQDYIDSKKNRAKDLGGKELDVFSLTGNKAEDFSPEKQFNK